MIAVIQRVNWAILHIESEKRAQIAKGLVILLGISASDTDEDTVWLTNKIAGLRIFSDGEGKMNLDLSSIEGEILVVSQFTLFASTKKGNRPSFTEAAAPNIAIPIYHDFIDKLQNLVAKPVQTGVFGADMQVSLQNDGPVTIIIDSKNKI